MFGRSGWAQYNTGAANGAALTASFGSVGSASLTSGGGAGTVTGFTGGTALRRFTAAAALSSATVIAYTYDALHRLTRADYSDGRYFVYAYDAVGNRLTEVACSATPTCTPVTTTYTYDDANRLETVNSAPYTWDDNGNLLVDGTFTYTYDAANRLIAATDGVTASSFVYNGLGDRVSQTVAGVVTTYTLDLAAGLTQVLADGTNTYLYGNGRIAQDDGVDFTYFLTDALGSVRQLADDSGTVTLVKSYEPYGDALSSTGAGASSYGYAGELFDSNTGLLYLRARYYSTGVGKFSSRDTWFGDFNVPLSLNGWAYSLSNPTNFSDPSGRIPTSISAIELKIVDYYKAHFRYPGGTVEPGWQIPGAARKGTGRPGYVDLVDLVWSRRQPNDQPQAVGLAYEIQPEHQQSKARKEIDHYVSFYNKHRPDYPRVAFLEFGDRFSRNWVEVDSYTIIMSGEPEPWIETLWARQGQEAGVILWKRTKDRLGGPILPPMIISRRMSQVERVKQMQKEGVLASCLVWIQQFEHSWEGEYLLPNFAIGP